MDDKPDCSPGERLHLCVTPRPFGIPAFRCSICGRPYAPPGIATEYCNTPEEVCGDCKTKIKNLIVAKLQTMGKELPDTNRNCVELAKQLEKYEQSGVRPESVAKYKKWFADKVLEYRRFEKELEESFIISYEENDISPTLAMLQQYEEIRGG